MLVPTLTNHLYVSYVHTRGSPRRESVNTVQGLKFRCTGTHLFEDQNLVGCLQVLQLVGDQDTRLVLQHATDAPDARTQERSKHV